MHRDIVICFLLLRAENEGLHRYATRQDRIVDEIEMNRDIF
jgi:hypothetical protein